MGIPKACRSPPSPQQRFLEGVVGVMHRAEHPVAVRVELGSVRIDQIREVAVCREHGSGQLNHQERVAAEIAEPEHRRNRGTHPRYLGVDVDPLRLELGVRRLDVICRQRDARLHGRCILPGRWGARAIPVVPCGG